MSCRKCQRETPPDALYCPYCGVQIEVKRNTHKRGNGEGTAIRRGRTWTARVVVAYVPSGDSEHPSKKAVYRTKGGFKTKRDALAYCTMLYQTDHSPKVAPKLIDYWTTYASGELAALSKSKQTAYRIALGKLKALWYRPVSQVTVKEIRDAVSRVATTYYTAKDCKMVLTRLFELGAVDGWCNKDVPSFIVLPPLQEHEREVFSQSEQSALWNLYESGDLRAAIPLLMICTGMMPGEARDLKVGHIDIEGQKITGIGKKTKIRQKSPIFLPEDSIPIVQDLIDHAQPSGYIWARDEKRWYEDYYAALEIAGCRRLEPYCCRHTTATRLAVTENIAPQTIKRMMRWSTAKMLDRYTHPDESDIISAANTITRNPE